MQVVQKAPLTVVGQQVVSDWRGLWTTMPTAWQQLLRRAPEIPHRVGNVFVDVSAQYDAGTYTQIVGAEVGAVGELPDQMVALEIPAQRYVYYRHTGPTSEIAASFGAMLEWAAEQGHRVDHFKLDFGYTEDGSETEHDLYVRIVP